MKLNKENLADSFLSMTDSLSKYRRAELKNESGATLIEELYVDPLEEDLILKSMIKGNTTLLMGRKGTGKSTIINRFQHEIRKSDNKLSLYIDVKALFEQTKKSYFNIQTGDLELTGENLDRLSLYTFFVDKVIEEIKSEIKSSVFKSGFKRFFKKEGVTEGKFNERLDALFNEVKQPLFVNVTAKSKIIKNETETHTQTNNNNVTANANVVNPSISGETSEVFSNESLDSQQFTKVLSRFFDIIGFMNGLKKLLQEIPIETVFICLDDMSEIDKESMEVFTDFIVGPLNNLSDEFFKFKISLYPGRDYLPSIDRQKVKTYCLDYYDLYSAGSIGKVEDSAIKYTQRLIEKRFNYYFKDVDIGNFFDLNKDQNMHDYYKIIFQISSNVPRIIGKILEIALQKTNSFERLITKSVLQESARQHYKNDIEFVLTKSDYIEYRSYDEAFEKFHLLDLLKKIIDKAIANKKHIGSSVAKIFSPYSTNTAPSNYLFISEDMEDVLKTLEFNFFITKFSQQKDKDGENISIFSLNYGLCIENNIIVDEKSDRKFRIERVFDYNRIVADWMSGSKELVCETCSQVYDIVKKPVFIEHKMPCITCQGVVVLRSIINDQQKLKIENNTKIQMKEYEILNALQNKEKMTATDLGDELDRPYQSINHSIGNNSKIKHFEFIKREKVDHRPYFSLTDNGKLYIQGDYSPE